MIDESVKGVDSAIDDFNHHSGKALIILNKGNWTVKCVRYNDDEDRPQVKAHETCIYLKGFLPNSNDLTISRDDLEYHLRI